MEYISAVSKPIYLCRWWIRARKIQDQSAKLIIEGKEWILPKYELYVPFWAKPLDFIWKLIFGNPKLVKENY